MTPFAARSAAMVTTLGIAALTVAVALSVRAFREEGQAGDTLPIALAQESDRSRGDREPDGEGAGTGRAPQEPRARDRGRPKEADRTRRDFDRNCLRSGCHAALGDRPRVHAPIAVGSCDSCHIAKGDAAAHDFGLVRQGADMCGFCHRPPAREAHVHDAFADGKCAACHDPHGGSTAALLANDDVARLCAQCHDAERPRAASDDSPPSPRWEHLHAPVKDGSCLACHAPHQSPHDGLLSASERELCLSCHEPISKSLASAAHVHEPAAKDCGSCHAAHGSRVPDLLLRTPRDLCLSCHEHVALDPPAGHTAHGALATEGSCVVCHEGHAAESPALVALPLGAACLACHDREISTASGEKIADVAREIRTAKHVHAPLREGKCEACHESHSSAHRDLLTEAHPRGPYSRFSTDTYALCLSCHDKDLVEEETTTKTAFRDGDRNLHYVHVHREKGRTCNLCHHDHAGEQPFLMRDSVPFGPGGWRLPLKFERTETGGACGAGCHAPMRYERSGETGRNGAGSSAEEAPNTRERSPSSAPSNSR